MTIAELYKYAYEEDEKVVAAHEAAGLDYGAGEIDEAIEEEHFIEVGDFLMRPEQVLSRIGLSDVETVEMSDECETLTFSDGSKVRFVDGVPTVVAS